ncbi:chromosome segregation SMC family protein [Patescibacteria group bacterium]
MYLQKIEIKGFKSFAEKTVLQFPKEKADEHTITAIVGPNGSGKSNIADAIRWVLGEQSLKTLRGKKSEDVIFAGSDKKTRLGFAEVSLYLNNESGKAPIDYSELVLTRRLYRNGESEYLINKNKVRLLDIQMLLAKAQIGQRTYSVIGQGMIDYFLIAPPNERKEFFDEAAGVKEYQIKRNQSLNKLINAHDNLSQTDLLLKEIDPRLKSLTRQMKKLEKRESLTSNLRKLQLNYYGTIKKQLNSHQETVQTDLDILIKQENELKKELHAIETAIQKQKEEETRSEAFNILRNKYDILIDEKNLLLRQQAVIKGNKEIEYKKIGKVNLIWLEKKYDEIKKEKEKIEDSISSISDIISRLDRNIKKISEKKEKATKDEQKAQECLDNLQANNNVKKINDKELEKSISLIYYSYQNLVKKLESAKDIEELNNIIKEAKQIDKNLNEILKELCPKDDQNAQKILIAKDNVKIAIQERENIIASFNKLLIEINGKKEREKTLKESLQKMETEEKNLFREISEAKEKPVNEQQKLKELEAKNQKIENQISELDKKINKLKNAINEFNIKEEIKKENLFELQKQYQEHQMKFNKLSEETNTIRIELAKITTKKEDLMYEIKQDEIHLTSENFEFIEHPENLLPQIKKIKEQLEFIGGIDPETKTEYTETKERFTFLSEQTTDLSKAITSLEKIIKELDLTIKNKFEKSFNAINKEFQKYFSLLFGGGKSNLIKIAEDEKETEENQQTSESEENIIAENNDVKEKNPLKIYKQKVVFGIEIQAAPPGKKINSINMLSGGERALTAIALLCAIISNNPSPFIVLDEVDAALDEANSHNLAKIIGELSNKSQFIVITHNRATMQKAKLLYGVSMGDDGISRLLSIKFEEAEKKLRS